MSTHQPPDPTTDTADDTPTRLPGPTAGLRRELADEPDGLSADQQIRAIALQTACGWVLPSGDLPLNAVRADPQAAYRAAARLHHPDVGGSDDAFHRVKTALDVLVSGGYR